MKSFFKWAILSSTMLICYQIDMSAQLFIDVNYDADELVDVLVGAGLEVSNADMNCPDNARAYYQVLDGDTSLVFDEGVLLTSGQAALANGPNDNGGDGIGNNGTSNDPDLNALVTGFTTNDVCALTFDFVPAGDTLTFQYVFGSEEYQEWVCSSFNDVFGFFIQGNEYPSYTNIALIPGSTTAVAINTINGGGTGGGAQGCIFTNTDYYVDNGDGFNAASGDQIQYDGLTVKLTAAVSVTPCEQYSFKLAIADGGDTALDSGVFLEAGSFSTNAITVEAETSQPDLTTNAIEGCVDGVITFLLENAVTDTTVVYYDIYGSAENGVDFTAIPDSTIILPNDTAAVILIESIDDGIQEGAEFLVIRLRNEGCQDLPLDSVEIFIVDNIVVEAEGTPLVGCKGQEFYLSATGALDFEWTPPLYIDDPLSATPIVTPEESLTYLVTGTVGNCSDTDSVTISVNDDFNPFVTPELDICSGGSVQLFAEGGAFYNWCYFDENEDIQCGDVPNLDNSNIDMPVISGITDTTQLAVVIIDLTGCRDTLLTTINVAPDQFLTAAADAGEVCRGNSTNFLAEGANTYEWSPAEGLSCTDCPNPIATPDQTTVYTVTGTIGVDCVNTQNLTVNVTEFTLDAGADIQDCLLFDGLIGRPEQAGWSYEWTPTDGLSDPSIAQPNLFLEVQNPSIPLTQTYTLTVTDDIGCQAADEIDVFIAANPTIIATATDTIIEGGIAQLSASGAGENGTYQWYGDDINTPNAENTSARPTNTVTYTVEGTNEFGCSEVAEVTIIVVEPPKFIVPSAFSPNGDGINDILRPLTYDIQELVSYRIFDRWGQVMYENPGDITEGWDGTHNGEALPMGVYVYYMEYIPRGTDEVFIHKGNVTIIR